MIYIENNSIDPFWNFALEYYLITEKQFPDDTVFLIWRTEPTLMIGKYQNAYEEINATYAEQHNIHVARRMSGGGTVYTDLGGWQYSFIEKENRDDIGFLKFTEPVVNVLRNLGVDAGFSGRNDLMAAGKKISGTAQYKHNGYLIHHGTLLYDSDLNAITQSLRPDGKKIISKGIKSVSERVANISGLMDHKLEPEEFRDKMIEGILGSSGTRYQLVEKDRNRINEIADETFRPWEAVYGAFPKCSITKTSYFKGGKMETHLDIQAGTIQNMIIFGDYFCGRDLDEFYNAFKGCRYDKHAIASVLQEADTENLFYHISKEEILEAII